MRGRITAACIRVLLATIEATRKKSTSLFHVVAQLVIVRLIICMLYKGKVSTTAVALSAWPLPRSLELPSLTNFKCFCLFFFFAWNGHNKTEARLCACWIESLLALSFLLLLFDWRLTYSLWGSVVRKTTRLSNERWLAKNTSTQNYK